MLKRVVVSSGILALMLVAYVVVTFRFPMCCEGVVWIEKGTSSEGIARLLKQQHLPAYPFHMWLFQKLSGKTLKSGEYELQKEWSLWQVCSHIASGRVVMHALTFPEGWTIHQVVEHICAEPLLCGDVVSTPIEGSALPDTYYFARGDTREHFLKRMMQSMDQLLAKEWSKRDPTVHLSREEVIILASIVESETPKNAEKPIIAGVFYNRLQKNMMLQSDPTVAYALTQGKCQLEKPLTFQDLKMPSPFNTYVQFGLPPHPIACPGRAALLAVLHPKTNPYIYFVADGLGGHVFSVTFDEHKNNVQKWRSIQKNNAGEPFHLK